MSLKDWNVRLRYTKVNGVERTQIPVICNKQVCHGYVSDSEWWVISLGKDKRVLSGKAEDNEQAKRDLKKALVALGAHFTEEVRATKDKPIRMLTEDVICDIIEEKEN
jgi:hypothetical protein